MWRLKEIGEYARPPRPAEMVGPTFALIDPRGCERMYGTLADFHDLFASRIKDSDDLSQDDSETIRIERIAR